MPQNQMFKQDLVFWDQSWNCMNSETGSEHWREIVYLLHTNNDNNKNKNNNKNSLRVKGSYIILMKSVWKRIQFPHWFTPNPGIRWWQAGRQAFSKCCYLLACLLVSFLLLLVTSSVLCVPEEEGDEGERKWVIHWRDDVHFFTTAN